MLRVLLAAQFTLVASCPGAATPAELVTSTNAPRGINIALRANGGKLELARPPAEEKFNPDFNDGYSTEWRARGKQLPQDIVLSFTRGGTAVVDRVVINTLTKETAEKTEHCPRDIEIAVSLASPTAGFQTIASAELGRKAGAFRSQNESVPDLVPPTVEVRWQGCG